MDHLPGWTTGRHTVLWKSAAVLAVTALFLAACGGNDVDPSDANGTEDEAPEAEDDGEDIVLQFASALPEGGLNYGFDWFADEVETRSNGRVTFERFYSASLFGVQETFAALGDGRVDLGWLGSAFFPSEMPLWSVAGVPFQTEHPLGQAAAFYELWESDDNFRAEWDEQGMRPLMFQPWSPGVMGTTDIVDEIDDLEGKRLRVVGFVAPAMEALGVEAVAIPTEEMYESIQRGVVDGYAPWSFDQSLVDAGITEVAPETTDLRIGHYASVPIAISSSTWDELPQDIQELLTDVAEEFMYEVSLDLYSEQQDATCEAIVEGGATVTRFTDEQRAELEERVGDVSIETWLANAEEQGIDRETAEAFRSDWRAIHDRIAEEVEWESGAEACAEQNS